MSALTARDGYPAGGHPFDLVLCECTTAGQPGRRIFPGVNESCPECTGRMSTTPGYRLRGDRPGTGYALTIDLQRGPDCKYPLPRELTA